eukprot:TRINITY_DN8330_c0_g1_i1.p1 TRINITY_DN8330_c0_g1~~TRINITY_DN8330_c0_g1_i1.p1  ORF type:complete len:115 (-),score=14.86 TRINITY_DN8330_c0_g1_i1:80-424(-)
MTVLLSFSQGPPPANFSREMQLSGLRTYKHVSVIFPFLGTGIVFIYSFLPPPPPLPDHTSSYPTTTKHPTTTYPQQQKNINTKTHHHVKKARKIMEQNRNELVIVERINYIMYI